MEDGTSAAADRPGHQRDVALGLALLTLGAGAATVAVLGPFVLGLVRYHASAGAVNQIVGGDVAGLALVAPAALAAGMLVLSGRRLGALLGLGPAGYGLYMYSQLALGGDTFRYPGNSERFFLLFVVLFVLAGLVLWRPWTSVQGSRLPEWPRWLARLVGVFALVVAAFLVLGLHLPGLLDALRPHPTAGELLTDPVVFWLVKFMDLGIVVPVLLLVGAGQLRRAPNAAKAGYLAVGWMALLGSSVAGMAIVMQARGAPGASWGNTLAFGSFAATSLAVAVLAYLRLRHADAVPVRQPASRRWPSKERA